MEAFYTYCREYCKEHTNLNVVLSNTRDILEECDPTFLRTHVRMCDALRTTIMQSWYVPLLPHIERDELFSCIAMKFICLVADLDANNTFLEHVRVTMRRVIEAAERALQAANESPDDAAHKASTLLARAEDARVIACALCAPPSRADLRDYASALNPIDVQLCNDYAAAHLLADAVRALESRNVNDALGTFPRRQVWQPLRTLLVRDAWACVVRDRIARWKHHIEQYCASVPASELPSEWSDIETRITHAARACNVATSIDEADARWYAAAYWNVFSM